jgi:hypothetical protein
MSCESGKKMESCEQEKTRKKGTREILETKFFNRSSGLYENVVT